jgi:hypothetical protein
MASVTQIKPRLNEVLSQTTLCIVPLEGMFIGTWRCYSRMLYFISRAALEWTQHRGHPED